MELLTTPLSKAIYVFYSFSYNQINSILNVTVSLEVSSPTDTNSSLCNQARHATLDEAFRDSVVEMLCLFAHFMTFFSFCILVVLVESFLFFSLFLKYAVGNDYDAGYV